MKDFIKITDDMLIEMTDEEILENISEKVKEEINNMVDSYLSNLLNSLVDCESPIEQLLSLKLNKRLGKYYSINGDVEILGNNNQATINVKDKTYRVDFLLEVAFKYKFRYLEIFKLIIECDGHEFHEKTKEQVRKDNERTRNLQRAGYEILRFSGSEIYINSDKCADEIIEFIFSRYNEFLERQN